MSVPDRRQLIDRKPGVLSMRRQCTLLGIARSGRLLIALAGVAADQPPECRSRWTAAGRWMDNVFVERLWRSLKHEDIYLNGYADGREAHSGIAAWSAFYNDRRPHSSLDGATPDQAYFNVLPLCLAA